jgi:hypothetical protein
VSSLVRRLTGADLAQETRVFVLMSLFGTAVGAVYWFVSYETAGTVLLLGFGLATAIISFRLAIDPASTRIRRRIDDGGAGPNLLPEVSAADGPGGGTAGIDRPFLDERGRIPDDTFAPFAVGLGAAIAATGLIFGPASLMVGLLPLLWGAWTWLSASGDELRASDRDRTDR